MSEEKTKLFTMKVKQSQLEKYKEFARSKGLPLSELIKKLLDNQPLPDFIPEKKKVRKRYEPVDPDLLRQVGAIGNNINQISRKLNRGEEVVEVAAVLYSIEKQLEEIVNAHKVSK